MSVLWGGIGSGSGSPLGPSYRPGFSSSSSFNMADPSALANALQIAGLQGQTQLGVAGTQAQAQRDVAASQLQGQLAGYKSQEQIAQEQQATQMAGFGSQERIAGTQAQTQLSGYQTQKDIAAQQAQTQLAGYGSQERVAQTQAAAAEYGPQLQQQRFNTLFPYVQGQMNALTSGGGYGAAGAGAAGTGQFGYKQGNQPYISDRPVYTGQDIQQQVNAQRAATDAATAGQTRQQQQQLAGRGFSSNSPLAAALQNAAWGQGLASNAAAEQQTRWTAAQGNAQQRLSAQQAQAQEFAQRQTEDIQRRQIAAQQQSALLSALAGMV